MPLVFASITPHPPIIIPEIGQGNLHKVQKTIQAFLQLEKQLIEAQPDTLVIISPHGPVELECFNILGNPILSGDFGQFGHATIHLEFRNDLELAQKLQKAASRQKIPLFLIESGHLDHGMLVPLFYLASGKLDNLPLVAMGFSFLPYQVHFELGKILGKAFIDDKKRIALIASGDLSHRLTPEAPAGYSEKGKIFDEKLIASIKKKQIDALLKMDSNLIEEAGECGLRSIIILLGALSHFDFQPEIYSYEGPFGVGYLVAGFKIKKQKQ